MPTKILLVAGARPNFIKIAPLMRAFAARPRFAARLVHTGQHYDAKLSKIFFEDLAIPKPDIELEIGSASHAQQTAEIMRRFEPVLAAEQPEAVLVVGDVNSTIGCALVTSKFFLERPFHAHLDGKRVERRRPIMIHVEAGLRSRDDDMPEEVNRKLTDAISDLLFVSDPAGMEHLVREGVPTSRTFFVGNVMIDTLLAAREQAMRSPILEQLGVPPRGYVLVTLHRPSNVDDPAQLAALLRTIEESAGDLPLVFPVHPRTRARLAESGLHPDERRWHLSEPLGYLDFLKLTAQARIVLTDSGGVQEETTVLGVPCVTLRENTERPVTITEGTNFLAGTQLPSVRAHVAKALAAPTTGRVPRYWDGKSAERIADILADVFSD
ncbi:MAG TPA: UDP-N-acetylglucosamine 2-epimerase (non-hydrolyzing) [Polyangia bacterium]|jgi:UDP-N-acetylglucosamine 2-epimerase (non-hydrolysing)